MVNNQTEIRRLDYAYNGSDALTAVRECGAQGCGTFADVETMTYSTSGLLSTVVDGILKKRASFSFDTSPRVQEIATPAGDLAYEYAAPNCTGGSGTYIYGYH